MNGASRTFSKITGGQLTGQAVPINSGDCLGVYAPAFTVATKWRLQGSPDGGTTWADVVGTDGSVQEIASTNGNHLLPGSYVAEFAGYTHIRPAITTTQGAGNDLTFIFAVGKL